MIFTRPVSKYANGKDVLAMSGVNISDDEAKANVLANLELGLQEVGPHMEQNVELMLVAGGPSLNDFEYDIIRKRSQGMRLCTVNGAYNWAVARHLKPGAQVVLDAREFNKRFVQPITPDCKYLLASQCHPDLVKSTPREQTWLWHCGHGTGIETALHEFDKSKGIYREYYPVAGSMTVMLRAIPLLIMLGFRKFHIYGWDSCLMGGDHHAYDQPENDCDQFMEVRCTGSDRVFKCHSWMVSQAQQFIDIQPMIAEHCEMAVYGDGLIAHIINTGAKLAETEH